MFVKSKLVKSTTRAVELCRQRLTRAARGGDVSGARAPAVRPQHVEVSVEEKHVEVRVHDARKARSRESIKPAMVDETRTAKLYPSLRLKEDPHTR